jgi:hypothetical protein
MVFNRTTAGEGVKGQAGKLSGLTVGGERRRVWGNNHQPKAMEMKLESEQVRGAASENARAGGMVLVGNITMWD